MESHVVVVVVARGAAFSGRNDEIFVCLLMIVPGEKVLQR